MTDRDLVDREVPDVGTDRIGVAVTAATGGWVAFEPPHLGEFPPTWSDPDTVLGGWVPFLGPVDVVGSDTMADGQSVGHAAFGVREATDPGAEIDCPTSRAGFCGVGSEPDTRRPTPSARRLLRRRHTTADVSNEAIDGIAEDEDDDWDPLLDEDPASWTAPLARQVHLDRVRALIRTQAELIVRSRQREQERAAGRTGQSGGRSPMPATEPLDAAEAGVGRDLDPSADSSVRCSPGTPEGGATPGLGQDVPVSVPDSSVFDVPGMSADGAVALPSGDPTEARRESRSRSRGGARTDIQVRGQVRGQVQMFGPPRILDAGGDLVPELRSGATQLLALLVAHPGGKPLPDLMEAIWPDASYRRASARLSTEVAALRRVIRQAVGDPTVQPVPNTGGHYHLDPDVVDVDVWAFTQHLSAAAAARTTIRTDTGTGAKPHVEQTVNPREPLRTPPEEGGTVGASGDMPTAGEDPNGSESFHLQVALRLIAGQAFAATKDYRWVTGPRNHFHRQATHARLRLAELSDAETAALLLVEAHDLDPADEHLAEHAIRALQRAARTDDIPHRLELLRGALAQIDEQPSASILQLVARLTNGQP